MSATERGRVNLVFNKLVPNIQYAQRHVPRSPSRPNTPALTETSAITFQQELAQVLPSVNGVPAPFFEGLKPVEAIAVQLHHQSTQQRQELDARLKAFRATLRTRLKSKHEKERAAQLNELQSLHNRETRTLEELAASLSIHEGRTASRQVKRTLDESKNSASLEKLEDTFSKISDETLQARQALLSQCKAPRSLITARSSQRDLHSPSEPMRVSWAHESDDEATEFHGTLSHSLLKPVQPSSLKTIEEIVQAKERQLRAIGLARRRVFAAQEREGVRHARESRHLQRQSKALRQRQEKQRLEQEGVTISKSRRDTLPNSTTSKPVSVVAVHPSKGVTDASPTRRQRKRYVNALHATVQAKVDATAQKAMTWTTCRCATASWQQRRGVCANNCPFYGQRKDQVRLLQQLLY